MKSRRTKVRPKLRALVRDLGHRIGEDIQEAREAVRRWRSLATAGHRIESGRAGLAVFRALAQLPDRAGGGIRLVRRTNFLPENFFGHLKHEERRRSGHKNLGLDLEHLPAEAALVRNLEDHSYVSPGWKVSFPVMPLLAPPGSGAQWEPRPSARSVSCGGDGLSEDG